MAPFGTKAIFQNERLRQNDEFLLQMGGKTKLVYDKRLR